MMMGLVKPEHMSMSLGDATYTEHTPRRTWQKQVWGRRMTMVFQHADEALNQNAKVRDVFAGLPSSRFHNDDTLRQALSEFFDLESDFLEKPVKHLSGGQKQRLNLLRCLTLETDLVIMDEPLNGLDFSTAVKVLKQIEERLQAGRSVLVISHNEEIFDALVPSENVYYLTASV
jgi:ABC-type dipeptide/oligopeptide/nickel transport system ATPase subunit